MLNKHDTAFRHIWSFPSLKEVETIVDCDDQQRSGCSCQCSLLPVASFQCELAGQPVRLLFNEPAAHRAGGV